MVFKGRMSASSAERATNRLLLVYRLFGDSAWTWWLDAIWATLSPATDVW